MNPDFWLDRWQRNQIGFHQPVAHAALDKHWHALGCRPGDRVFVPLAGKSLDMLWLRDRGFTVVGVELSELAVRDFFKESGLHPQVEQRGTLQRFTAPDVELWCGDYFALDRAMVGAFTGVFDRASLIALPASMRSAYVNKMNELCAKGTRMLLVTLEYEQSQMSGPPFGVMEDEVRALYGSTHQISVLERETPPDFARFSQRGVTHMEEVVYQLERY